MAAYLSSNSNGGKFDPAENCPAPLTFSGSLRWNERRPETALARSLAAIVPALANFTAARYSNPKMQRERGRREAKRKPPLLSLRAPNDFLLSLTPTDGDGENENVNNRGESS